MDKILIADTPEKINGYRLLTLKAAFKLELLGMKRHGRSVYSIVKEEFGLRGNKKLVYEQFVNILTERGILR